MNSLVAHDQLANLNFGKLRINSEILRYLSFAGIFSYLPGKKRSVATKEIEKKGKKKWMKVNQSVRNENLQRQVYAAAALLYF